MKNFFRNPIHQQFYEKNGYIKLPLLNTDEVNYLLEIYRKLPPPIIDIGLHSSLLTQRIESRTISHEAIASIVWKKAEPVMDNFRASLGTFVIKEKGDTGFCYYHQDWTFVEEENGDRSFNVWCPLMRTDVENGILHVLPGSHRIPIMPRVAPSCYYPYRSEQCEQFIREKSIALPADAGEAIIYDNAMIHYSPPNRTNLPRVAVGLLIVPRTARLVHLSGSQDSFSYEKYLVDENFYLNYLEISRPSPDIKPEKLHFEDNRDPYETLVAYC